MKKALFCAACSTAISLTFFMGLYSIAKHDVSFWLALAAMNLAIWSSFPRYRSPFLRMATTTLALLVLANPVVSLVAEELSPRTEQTPHLLPYTALRINIIDGALPGLSGVRHISVDGHGFRTNGPIDYGHKPPGVLRVVGIGASTMEEGFLDDEATWTNLVAAQLSKTTGRKVEMINTAYSGLRAEHNYRTLLESAVYAPDVAIFLMGINDWNHAILEKFKPDHRPGRMGVLQAVGRLSVNYTLLYRGIEIAAVTVTSLLDHWGIDLPLRNEDGAEVRAQSDSLSRPVKVAFHPDSVSDDYRGWVAKIMLECRSRSIQCVFVDQPTAYHPEITSDLRKRLWMTPLNAPYTLSFEDISHVASVYNEWLGLRAKEMGFRFCAISPHVPSTTDYFFDDCHYNDNGSRTVARLVSECLADLR